MAMIFSVDIVCNEGIYNIHFLFLEVINNGERDASSPFV